MFTRLLPILLILLSLKSFALSIVNDVIEGSKLCDNLSTTYSIPSEFQGRYDYEVKVEKTDTNLLIIKYFLVKNSGVDSIKNITTDLNQYFSKALPTEQSTWWTVNFQLIIDNIEISSIYETGLPFKDCYEYKKECNKIKVYRKSLRPICSSINYYAKHSVNMNDNILNFDFTDSTASKLVTCQAIGSYVHIDSLQADQLAPKNYKIQVGKKIFIVCVTTPCPPYYFDINFTANVNLSNCPEIDLPSITTTGSALCNNLIATYKLAPSNQGNYKYETEIVKDENNTFTIHYYLTENSSAEKITQISTDISIYFNQDQPLYPSNKVWGLSHILHINGNTNDTTSTQFHPYTTCYEVNSACIGITVYRKLLRPICPQVDVWTKSFIEVKNDVVMVDFIDSTYNLEAICLAEGYITHTDSIKVTESDGLKNMDYRIFLGTHIECALGACPTMWLYEPQIGKAFLSNCIINSFEDELSTSQLIFPNPAHDHISIKNFEGEVTLTNQFGQQFPLSGASHFSVYNLPRGLYIATFNSNGETIREKIVIQ